MVGAKQLVTEEMEDRGKGSSETYGPVCEGLTQKIRPSGSWVIPNDLSPSKDSKAGKGIARFRVGAILERMVWENLSKEVTFEQKPD